MGCFPGDSHPLPFEQVHTLSLSTGWIGYSSQRSSALDNAAVNAGCATIKAASYREKGVSAFFSDLAKRPRQMGGSPTGSLIVYIT
jgi:hypothetical protein